MDDRSERHEKALQCEEVWGGNRRVDRRVLLPGLDAWVLSRPCCDAVAGGDVHYVSACSSRQLVRILVADVSGHGMAVAEKADALRLLMRRLVNDRDQQRFVFHLNREFIAAGEGVPEAGRPADYRYATAVALTYDNRTHRLLVCNAGHPPPLWYRAADRRWTTLEPAEADSSRNLPVGVLDGIDYEQFELDLAVGDVVLCYTDSLTEANDAAGGMLGTAGLLDLIRVVGASDPARLVAGAVSALGRLDPLNLTRDDFTCLALRVT